MVQVHGTMVPIKCLHLILFLLVALHARVVRAAPLPVQGANEDGSNDYPASRLDVGLEPLGHLEGPPRSKFQEDGGRKSPQELEVLIEILKEQEGGHELDEEAVRKEAFPEGSRNSLPVGAAERRLMRGTSVLDAVTGKAMPVLTPPKASVVYLVCPEDVRRRCMITTAALMVSLLFGGLFLCCGMHWWRKRKQRRSAASGTRPGTPQTWTPYQQPPRPPSRGPLRPPSPVLTAQQQTQNQLSTRPPTPNPPPRPPSPRVLPQRKN